MRATFGALAAVVAGGLMASCQPNATSPADAFRADAAALQRGKALFVGTCAGYCHSTAAINRDAPYLFDCAWLHGDGSDRQIFDVIAAGVPDTAMIGFQGKLPRGDDDIWRLVAYITASGASDCDG